MTQEDYLAHHGVLGQKWGVRRYQNYDGSLTSLGRKHRGLSENSGKSAAPDVKKILRNVQKAMAKRKADRAVEREAARKVAQQKAAEDKEAKKVRDHERLKERIRKHPAALYKYRDELTREEANELIDLIQWDRKIADIKLDELKRFNSRTKEVSTAIKNASDIFNSGISLYNNTALIYNAMVDHQVKAGTMTAEDAKKKKMTKADWNDKKDDGEGSGEGKKGKKGNDKE